MGAPLPGSRTAQWKSEFASCLCIVLFQLAMILVYIFLHNIWSIIVTALIVVFVVAVYCGRTYIILLVAWLTKELVRRRKGYPLPDVSCEELRDACASWFPFLGIVCAQPRPAIETAADRSRIDSPQISQEGANTIFEAQTDQTTHPSGPAMSTGQSFRDNVRAHLERLEMNVCRNEDSQMGRDIRCAIELLNAALQHSFSKEHAKAHIALDKAMGLNV